MDLAKKMGGGGADSFSKMVQNTQLISHGNVLFNALIIVVTFSGESIFRRFSFSCPCAFPQNRSYSGVFFWAPSICLFLIGLLLNSTTWKLIHGCWFRTRRTAHGCRRSCYYWGSTLSQALVAPVAWLFVALLDGSYYECFKASDFCLAGKYANGTSTFTLPAEALKLTQVDLITEHLSKNMKVDPSCVCKLPDIISRHLKAESQFFAWITMSLMILTLIASLFGLSESDITFCYRCLDRFTFSQNYYVNLYREVEEQKFEAVARETAEKLAEKNCRRYFEREKNTKMDWDKISKVPLNDFPHWLDRKELSRTCQHYLTPLDEWNREHCKAEHGWDHTLTSLGLKPARSLPNIDDDEDATDAGTLLPKPYHSEENVRGTHDIDFHDKEHCFQSLITAKKMSEAPMILTFMIK